jgi:hypothetical protein
MKTVTVIYLNEEDITRTEVEDAGVLYEGRKPDWSATYRDQEGYNWPISVQIMRATKPIVIFNDDEDQMDHIWCHEDDKAEITKPYA